MSNENQKDTRTVAQKLSDLELGVGRLFNINDNVARDLSILKSATKLLNNKVDAVIKAASSGEPVTDSVIDRIMVENNVADLTNRVAGMVTNGIVALEEQVSENSFVVGSESDDSGKVVNPRIQFALKALAPALQEKLLGKKAGDVVQFEEGKLSFKVLESYKINETLNAVPAPTADNAAADLTAQEQNSPTEEGPQTAAE